MNPQKSAPKINLSTVHRIIVVVYIPNDQIYYQNVLEVFKTCIRSIISTIDNTAALTVVNNGSFESIAEFLQPLYDAKKIDTLISHNTNIGKIDALIGAARGCRERYITLADADVLFSHGWQQNVEQIFSSFPNVGSVSPIPVRMGLYHATSSVLLSIFRRKLKFRLVPIPENLHSYDLFLKSINWSAEISADQPWPVVEAGDCRAVVGSAHQVMTIDRDILFTSVPTNPSLTLVGLESEHVYVDAAIDRSRKLRLSTYHNFAFHMGNTLETWMEEVQRENENTPVTQKELQHFQPNPDLNSTAWSLKFYNFQKIRVRNWFKKTYGKGWTNEKPKRESQN